MSDDATLLNSARNGDSAAFDQLIAPFVPELELHCYRLTGSYDDAQDVCQEALLRAWRHLGTFQPTGSFRSWLYRIATNTGLTTMARRSRSRGREVTVDFADAAAGIDWLQPYPIGPGTLADVMSGSPEDRYALEESVRLAFIVALQLLPPRQRAALLLKDVCGLRVGEIAELLGTTNTATSSVIQRARATLDRCDLGPDGGGSSAEVAPVVDAFIDTLKTGDIDALIGLLSEGAVLTMPPQGNVVRGLQAIRSYLDALPPGRRPGDIEPVLTEANGSPAVVASVRVGSEWEPRFVIALDIVEDAIATITLFTDPSSASRFLPT